MKRAAASTTPDCGEDSYENSFAGVVCILLFLVPGIGRWLPRGPGRAVIELVSLLLDSIRFLRSYIDLTHKCMFLPDLDSNDPFRGGALTVCSRFMTLCTVEEARPLPAGSIDVPDSKIRICNRDITGTVYWDYKEDHTCSFFLFPLVHLVERTTRPFFWLNGLLLKRAIERDGSCEYERAGMVRFERRDVSYIVPEEQLEKQEFLQEYACFPT
jgi:hypothetical protein